MYLSKLTLNTDNTRTRRALADPYAMHRLVWWGFPDKRECGPGRVLFRVEPLRSNRPPTVLVQSQMQPNWGLLKAKDLLCSAESKAYVPRVDAGQTFRFRLRANPTARKIVDESVRTHDGRPKRARVGLFGEDRQKAWLERKARNAGFVPREYRIEERRDVDSRKPESRERIRHSAVDFEGILQVTDPEQFLKTLKDGVGSAKGFGFGLLSVAPVR